MRNVKIQRVAIENSSKSEAGWKKHINVIKRRNYTIDRNVSVGGDAPKEFIKVYEYGRSRRNNASKWVAYIAKVGHKWYPVESITEHLLNRIGEVLGLDMAKSQLAILGDQLFFLSEYFLDTKCYELVHGADIYAGYIYDKNLVEEIEANALARTFFTFQFAKDALNAMFPQEADQLVEAFVNLLFFDAIVGNNDRHFYNWAIMRHIENKKAPKFAPIFDSARGLFWNKDDDRIAQMLLHPKQLDSAIEKYCNSSMPKTGWEGDQNLNHFELVKKICESDEKWKVMLQVLVDQNKESQVIQILNTEFEYLLSKSRREIIKRCLQYRFNKIRWLIKNLNHDQEYINPIG